MRGLACMSERLEIEFRQKLGEGARLTRCLNLQTVEQELRTGKFAFVAVDPSCVSKQFFRQLTVAIAKSSSSLWLWTALDPQTTSAILEASALVQVDLDRKSTRLNSSHIQKSRMPSSA